MKKNLLVEVNRMREMMGLSLLNEQASAATKKVLRSMGYSDEAIEALVKSGIDFSDLTKLADDFNTLGIKNMDDWQSSLAARGVDLTTATDSQILKLIDQNPELKSALSRAYQKAVVDATEELVKKIGVLPSSFTTEVLTNARRILNIDNAEAIANYFNLQVRKIDAAIDNLINNGNPVPDELLNLKKLSLAKQIEAENFKKTVDSGTDPEALIPTSKPPLPKNGPDDLEVEDIIKKFRDNPAKYPYFDNFLITIKSLGFKKNIENILIASYEKYYNYTPDQLIMAGTKIVAELNEKNWGWAKKMFRDVSTGKLKVKNVASLLGLVVFLAVAIPWSLTGYETSEKIRKEYSDWAGVGGDSDEPTIEDAKAWIKDLNGVGGDLEGLSVTGFAKDSSGVENEYVATLSDGRAQKLLWDPSTKKFTPQ